MAQAARRAMVDEVERVLKRADDPDLDALRVAIYLEDAADVTLPPQSLDWQHLGSTAAIEQVLDGLEQL